MRNIFIALCVAYVPMASAYDPGDLVGTWQSNEELTLRSMEATPGIPNETRAFFRNGFFGRLIVVSRINESAVYFVDEKPKDLEFHRHVIHKVSNNQFRVEYPEEEVSGDSAGIMTLEGNCYSLEVSKWKFKEYFFSCREKPIKAKCNCANRNTHSAGQPELRFG